MRKLIFAVAVIALTGFTGPAFAAAKANIVGIVASRSMPDAGTPEEAEVCALEGTIMAMAAMDSTDIKTETKDALTTFAAYWVKRAAANNSQTVDEYMRDTTFVDTLTALAAVNADNHLYITGQCTDRMK